MITNFGADGTLLKDADGYLVYGQSVTRQEHFARLAKCYLNHWRKQLESTDANAANDARNRLDLMRQQVYVSPVDKRCRRVARTPSEAWQVDLEEYDRRLKLFVITVHRESLAVKIGLPPLHGNPPSKTIEYFVSSPSSLGYLWI